MSDTARHAAARAALRGSSGLPAQAACRTLARVRSAWIILGTALLVGLAVVQPLAAAPSAAPEATVETVRVAPGGTVRIVATGRACAAGRTVIVSGKPIASTLRRNGLGILRVKAEPGRIRVSFRVPADTGPGRYPVTMRCLRTPADTVGPLIPGTKVIVVVTR